MADAPWPMLMGIISKGHGSIGRFTTSAAPLALGVRDARVAGSPGYVQSLYL